MNDQRTLKRISVFLFIVAVGALIVHLVVLASFNQRMGSVHGNDGGGAVRMTVATREGSTSTWVKRDFDLDGKTVDLTGTTIDGVLVNDSADAIAQWTLRLNIEDDCLINQAWNGEVEIHQFSGEGEKVQRLNLQDYNLEDVSLDYLYNGDLMIPLKRGDYVIYHPSEKLKEMPLAAGEDVTIGAIFYHFDALDLSNFDLEFNYHRDFPQGPTFYVFALFLALFLLSLLMHQTSVSTYRRAQKEMELRKSSISCMSDLYAMIYIVDLVADNMVPVSVLEGATHEYRKNASAKQFLLDGVEAGVSDAYQDVVREFVNIETLAERLKNRNSVVCEFVSRRHGWCIMRFSAMDRVEGKALKKVLFTVQDINDEKNEMSRIEERISKVESESKAKSIFLASASRDIKEPIYEMLDFGDKIARESGEERIRAYAEGLREAGDSLVLLIDGIADYSELEAGRIELEARDYSLKKLVSDMEGWARALAGERQVAFELDVSPKLPDGLRGDENRLKRVIGNLLVVGFSAVETGSVKLSVYGKALDGKVHLLVSVKAAGSSAGDDAQVPVSEQSALRSGAVAGIGMDLVEGLLGLMGSELKAVHSHGEWSEYYFEVEQEVVDSTTIGEID